MRMKSLSNFFIGMLAVCALAGCSDNEVSGNEPDIYPVHPEDAVYMNVNIQLPVAGGSTRSQTNTDDDKDYGTSTGGTETGQDYENKVNGVLVVLADMSNNFIASGEHNSLPVVDSKGVVTSTQKINKSTLAAYYTANGTNGVLTNGKDDIKIYVFCNPTMELKSIFTRENISNTWVNEIATLEEDSKKGVTTGTAIWGGNDHKAGFLMTTASSQNIDKKIPKSFADWDDYTNEKNAFNFTGENNNGNDAKYINNKGNIKVERAVARFDFKDGSGNNRKYVVAKNENKPSLYVQLNRIALVNMSKHFYYLRRVSADGTLTNAEICGTEYPTNYVVDTDASEKVKDINKQYPYGTYFNFCLGHQTSTDWNIDETAREQWSSELIENVLKNDEDKDDSWNNSHNRDGYHIWRYATENTIPGIEEQKNGISTGIVFKGKILPAEDNNTPTTLKDALTKATGNPDTDPILYSYSDKLYVSWKEVREAALSPEANEEFKKAVFGTPKNTPSKTEYSNDDESPDYLWNIWYNTNKHNDASSLAAFKKVVTDKDHQFTLYQSSKDATDGNGYYCYYFYWNRHNDNGNNGVMGTMEFAVVRNNVYKLSVTEIGNLGHPRITENDPDPVDPDDPDEKGDIFFKLSVEVLPWVVRVNDIEF